MIGRTISHFRIIEKLGAGGMGIVYRAEDVRLRRTVALKFLPADRAEDGAARARLRREAEAASSLDHPNVCTIHEIGESEDGQLFIAMPCYEGETLAARVARGPLPLADALAIGEQVARGLGAAHACSLAHRDLKPGNVFLTRDGGVKILDFGLVKRADASRLTETGAAVGTVHYMAPEQARGEEAGQAADLWALGCVLYEMVAGRPPFRGEFAPATIYAILNAEPEPLTAVRTGVPPELERIVSKALRKESCERYRHADDVEADLCALRNSLARTASGATGTARPAAGPATGSAPAPMSARSAAETIDAAPAAGTVGRRRHRTPAPARARVLAIGAAFAALLAAGWLLFGSRLVGTGLAAAPKPVAVLAFENLTGDPAYDYLGRAIPNLLITSLEQSKTLRVTTWERLEDLLRLAGRAPGEKLDVETAFDVCRRDGIEAVVVGSFVRAGGTFATEAKVLDVRTKELLETASARGAGPESILRSQIDALSHDIASRLAGSRLRPAPAQKPVIDVTTTSLEAYQEYLRGRDMYAKIYNPEARAAFARAVAIDSTFAMAQLYLGRVLGVLRMLPARDSALRRAMALSERATERERLLIQWTFTRLVRGDEEAAQAILLEYVRKYPSDKRAHVDVGEYHKRRGHLAEAAQAYERALDLDPDYAEALNALGYARASLGDFDRALACIQRYVEVCPGDANPLDSLGETYFLMHRFDEAVAQYEAALALKPDFIGTMLSLAYVEAVRGDAAQVRRWCDQALAAAPTPGLQARSLMYRSFYRAHFGDQVGAEADVQRARELFGASENEEGQRGVQFLAFGVSAAAGRWDEARERLNSWWDKKDADAPAASRRPRASWLLSLGEIDVRRGDLAQARRTLTEARALVAAIEREEPNNALVFRDRAALSQAELLLAEGRAPEAVSLMRKEFTCFAPHMETTEQMLCNMPLHKDVVARAWLAQGQVDSALVEYQRLTGDGRPRRDLYVYNRFYDFRLAKLYEQKGRLPEARAAYGRFVAFCEGANPAPAECAEARARLAALP